MKSIKVALKLAARGWPVLPVCWPDQEGNCGCGKHHPPKKVGKAPLTDNGIKDATTDPKTIRDWWKRWPQANVAVDLVTAGLLAVDTDSQDATAEAKELGLHPTIKRVSHHPAWIYRRPDDCPACFTTNWGDSGEIDLLGSGYLVVHGRHRTGCAVYLEEIDTEPTPAPEWAVEVLKDVASLQNCAPVELPEELAPLDLESLNLQDDLHDLILTGGLDRSNAVFSVSTGLVRLGFQDHEIASILWDSNFAISEKPREQGLEWLAGDIGRARVKGYLVHPKTRNLAWAVCAWMEQQEWKGQDANSDWHLLLAHLAIVRRTGKAQYNASLRDLAEKAGIDKDTVVASYRRLVQRGVLVMVNPGRQPNGASTWRLEIPASSPNQISSLGSGTPHMSTPAPDVMSTVSTSSVAIDVVNNITNISSSTLCVMYVPNQFLFHDVWRWGALGKVALRLWGMLLSKHQRDVAGLAEELRVSTRQVRETLNKLAEHGLAEKVRTGRWGGRRGDEAHLNQIAQDLGVAGKTDRQRAAHKLERQRRNKSLRKSSRENMTIGRWLTGGTGAKAQP